MLKEHDRVVLKTDISQERLEAGDVGTVVHIHAKGDAFEVESLTLEGETVSVTTVPASHLRPVGKHDVTHARPRKQAV